MKKPSWCEKHFKIRRAVSELQNSSSHFNRTALYKGIKDHVTLVENYPLILVSTRLLLMILYLILFQYMTRH